MLSDSIKNTIRNLATLAERGATEGERDVARAMLNAKLLKYGITLDEVLDIETKHEYEFSYTRVWEYNLLYQIVAVVTHDYAPKTFSYKDGRKKRTKVKSVFYHLTKGDYVEIDFIYPQWRAAYEQELKKL